jgi:hypothetical protein
LNYFPGLIVLSEVLPSSTNVKDYVRELTEGRRKKAVGDA